jgi:uncharacterized protein
MQPERPGRCHTMVVRSWQQVVTPAASCRERRRCSGYREVAMDLDQSRIPPPSRTPGLRILTTRPRPGSPGEHLLQERCGTAERATRFYDTQFCDRLTPKMVEFIGRMEMAFIATSDGFGECDCSFRAGAAGFLRVLDERTIAYPEFRGNGVMASLGNILENPHVGLFMVDFTHDLIGLHVNGHAEIVTPARIGEIDRCLPEQATHPGRRPVHWVLVSVTEAYIHCSKHIPKLMPQSRIRHWGTDNPRHKGGDYFGAVAQNLAGLTDGPQPAGTEVAGSLGEAG